MKVVNTEISIQELTEMSLKMFDDLVKVVVDIQREIMVVDVGMHSDAEGYLLENGSLQENLWGINLYPNIDNESWIEFDSMINIRPVEGNKGRGVYNVEIQKKIVQIVNKLVRK